MADGKFESIIVSVTDEEIGCEPGMVTVCLADLVCDFVIDNVAGFVTVDVADLVVGCVRIGLDGELIGTLPNSVGVDVIVSESVVLAEPVDGSVVGSVVNSVRVDVDIGVDGGLDIDVDGNVDDWVKTISSGFSVDCT
ncbi:MAG: hypothetical protein AB1489_30915 [Acidobacteriota bacterium]